MKTIMKQSPKASHLLVERATTCGIDASIIEKSKPESRRQPPDILWYNEQLKYSLARS